MVGKVEETLDPVQGHFGLKEAIDHPREVVEGKNEHAHQCQGGVSPKYTVRGSEVGTGLEVVGQGSEVRKFSF